MWKIKEQSLKYLIKCLSQYLFLQNLFFSCCHPGQVFQSKFLVMTKKNIFIYKEFLSLKIIFQIIIYVKTAARKKFTPLFPSSPLLKNWDPVNTPTFCKFGGRFNSQAERGGSHYSLMHIVNTSKIPCNQKYLCK